MNIPPTVRVGVFWKSSKGRYFLKWQMPGKPNPSTRQTNITTRNKRSERKAMKLAEALQDELDDQLRGPDSDPLWDDFCDRYKRDHLEDTSIDNLYKWRAARVIFEDVVESEFGRPIRLSDISPLLLASVETEMRSRLAAGSVGSYMATLRGGLSWAAAMELMREMPRRRSRGRQAVELPVMRLEPITEDGLKRMLDACPGIVGKSNAGSVKRYLRALWLSGCRMREPLGIHASRRDCHRPLQLDGPTPCFCWTSDQKNKRDVIARITLDFAADVRLCLRDGFLYQPRCDRFQPTCAVG